MFQDYISRVIDSVKMARPLLMSSVERMIVQVCASAWPFQNALFLKRALSVLWHASYRSGEAHTGALRRKGETAHVRVGLHQ